MLRNDLANLICARLVRPDLFNSVVSEMQFIQATELEGSDFLPWFCRKDDTTSFSTVANVETVALPSDFIRFDESGLFYYNQAQLAVPGNSPWMPIARDSDYGHMIQTYTKVNALSTANQPVTQVQAPPIAYFQGDNGLYYLSPVPNQVWQLRVRYYQAQAVLTSNIENNWTKYAPDWIAGEVGYSIATQYVENPAKAQMFDAMRVRAKARLLRETTARDMADVLGSMGDPS